MLTLFMCFSFVVIVDMDFYEEKEKKERKDVFDAGYLMFSRYTGNDSRFHKYYTKFILLLLLFCSSSLLEKIIAESAKEVSKTENILLFSKHLVTTHTTPTI